MSGGGAIMMLQRELKDLMKRPRSKFFKIDGLQDNNIFHWIVYVATRRKRVRGKLIGREAASVRARVYKPTLFTPLLLRLSVHYEAGRPHRQRPGIPCLFWRSNRPGRVCWRPLGDSTSGACPMPGEGSTSRPTHLHRIVC